MGIALAGWIVRWRFWILAAAVVIVALAGSGARNLQFTTDYRVFFSEEDPQLTAFEILQDTYTKNDNIMFVLAPKGGDVFTRETLSAIETLTDFAWKTPYSIRVDSLTNFQFTRANDDALIVGGSSHRCP